MRIVLLETNPETTPIFETWGAYLGIHLTAVTSERLLRHKMGRAAAPDLLILDCSRGHPGYVALCRRVALRSGIETWVRAGGPGLVEELTPIDRVPRIVHSPNAASTMGLDYSTSIQQNQHRLARTRAEGTRQARARSQTVWVFRYNRTMC